MGTASRSIWKEDIFESTPRAMEPGYLSQPAFLELRDRWLSSLPRIKALMPSS
jgi:hypothetical protein